MVEKEFKTNFTYQLRRIMRKNNLDQKALAELSGLSEDSITRYIRGQRIPSAYILKRLSEALGCTMDDLVQPKRYTCQLADNS